MSFLELLRKHSGQALDVPVAPVGGPGAPRRVVSYTGEFRRVEALPRRVWEDFGGLDAVADELHNELRLTEVMDLFRIQAAALFDIALQRGALLPIGVGRGKALISLLAGEVLEAKRPLLLVPAQLRVATLKQVIPAMAPHWKIPPNLMVRAYSELSQLKNDTMLEDLQPDLIILDEAHRVSNKKSGRGRRLVRYFGANPDTMCVALSGTLSQRSLRDFAHIAKWCLKERSPVPSEWRELCEWADAIDVKVPDEQRVATGALRRLAGEDSARANFRKRFTETPGVVASKEDTLGVSLTISKVSVGIPPELAVTMDRCREMWERPDGVFFSEAVELWRLQRGLALGVWRRWEPEAPEDWLEARNNWNRYVRETLKNNRRKLDTPLQVWNEIQKLHDDTVQIATVNHCDWCRWSHIKDTFRPNPVAQWVSSHALKWCTKWLKSRKSSAPGIAWVEQVDFGRELAKVSGFPYYGAGDDSILDDRSCGIIASIGAHAEGKNLQHFSTNLITSMPASGKKAEQLIARTHRYGQEANEVTVEIVIDIEEQLSSFLQARADADYIEEAFGNRQKLNYATILGIQ